MRILPDRTARFLHSRRGTLIALVCLAALIIALAPGERVRAQGGTLVWTAGAPMPPADHAFGMAVGGNGRIYVFGGQYGGRATREYDPVTNTWTPKANMPRANLLFAGASGPDGRVYAFGGWTGGWFTNAVDAYDPATNTWSPRAPMPTARHNLAAGTTTKGIIYAVGGSEYLPFVPMRTVEAYSAQSNTWSQVAPMNIPRMNPAVVGGSNGKLYVLGGYSRVVTTNGSYELGGIEASVEEYDPVANTWTLKAPMPTPRMELSAAATPDGRIYAIGGFYGTDGNVVADMLPTVEVFDIEANTWRTETPLPVGRFFHGSVFLDNALYVIGGYHGVSLDSVDVAVLTPNPDTTPPVSAATVTGDAGLNGWYLDAVQVALGATDSGSGVASTLYSLNGGAWTPYTGPIAVGAEGLTTVAYYSTDLSGNVEVPARLQEIKIDSVAPVVTYTGNAGTYTIDQYVDIHCAADDGGSGLGETVCEPVFGPASGFGLGTHTFTATVSDIAGNVTIATTTFVVTDNGNAWAALRQMVLRVVTKPGVAQALIAKLDAAQAAAARGDLQAKAGIIKAFINQVEAQAGKCIAPADAATLIQMARLL